MVDRGSLVFLNQTHDKMVCLGNVYDKNMIYVFLYESRDIFLYWYFDDESYLKDCFHYFGNFIFTEYPFNDLDVFTLAYHNVTDINKSVEDSDLVVYETKVKMFGQDYPEKLYTYKEFKASVDNSIQESGTLLNQQLDFILNHFAQVASVWDISKIKLKKKAIVGQRHTFGLMRLRSYDFLYKKTLTEEFEDYMVNYM